jgi:hypothetical protein
MKNGREYCHSIHQQIIELLEKARLSEDEQVIINKLDFGRINLFFYVYLEFSL